MCFSHSPRNGIVWIFWRFCPRSVLIYIRRTSIQTLFFFAHTFFFSGRANYDCIKCAQSGEREIVEKQAPHISTYQLCIFIVAIFKTDLLHVYIKAWMHFKLQTSELMLPRGSTYGRSIYAGNLQCAVGRWMRSRNEIAIFGGISIAALHFKRSHKKFDHKITLIWYFFFFSLPD